MPSLNHDPLTVSCPHCGTLTVTDEGYCYRVRAKLDGIAHGHWPLGPIVTCYECGRELDPQDVQR